ncbi:four-carbon acid sugar kinase family protein [Haloarcula sp. CBA1130]|uniref:four-carbon acid sugar kinase family protein n=1 Tax=unclassified Haloarcula TaxID=2624677 RepID=UPI001247A415|nr:MULTISPECIES: four-carbon acid sugar kinase family protein [unclassified Haloarcula]KAA9396327.1 four-carbon acid sugar kinase family protein [Haloarcula sp. CBA1130]KAA9398320.1 four-carbon acid sugar kinase family protein [Haloarcula sp. CBA1129]
MTDTELLLAFYGDDFTGSTDALEGLADNGVRAVLFMEPPTPAELERFDDLDAVGVAGVSRSMTPEEMTAELPSIFERFADLDAPIVHYKVCSTFDSSPEVGSIGTAIDVAQEVFDSPFVPVSQGTEVPHGRFVAFSNLFAEQGGEMYRIDRHPTMRDHPVTPMRESDLRRHLGEQTDRPIGGVDRRFLESYTDLASAVDETAVDDEIVVLDALDSDHLARIGHLLWDRATDAQGQLFAVGSSGLEHHALVSHWDEIGLIDRTESFFDKRDPVDRIAVMSGSASAETASQIEWASDHGFQLVSIDTERLVDPDEAAEARDEVVESALDALDAGESVVLYSARGPDDPAIDATRERFEAVGIDEGLESYLGREQGRIFREVLQRADLDRACVAGGDTSSHVVSQLNLQALEAVAPVAPGGPLCRVYSDEEAFDGLEIALKGGQVHTENDEFDYFGAVERGGVERDQTKRT